MADALGQGRIGIVPAGGPPRVISAGAASVLGIGVGGMNVTTGTGATTLVDASRALFGQYRRLGQVSGPGALLPQLISQTHSLQQLAARSGTRTRQALLVLASRFAEYTGWMAQESGNDDAALWWTDRAVELAGAGNDDSLAAYALARRSLISLFRGDTDSAVDLATHALDSHAPPRIKGLAAQKLAQCQAVKGDYDAACAVSTGPGTSSHSNAATRTNPSSAPPTCRTWWRCSPAGASTNWDGRGRPRKSSARRPRGCPVTHCAPAPATNSGAPRARRRGRDGTRL